MNITAVEQLSLPLYTTLALAMPDKPAKPILKKDRNSPRPPLAIATENDGSTVVNKAFAIVRGRLTPDGLIMGYCSIENVWIAPQFKLWLNHHPLPTEDDASFAAWFRTDNKTGFIKSVSLIGLSDRPNHEPNTAVVAGRVFKAGKKRISVRVFPTFKNARPFTVALNHDGAIRVKELWAMQFDCEIKDGMLHVIQARSLRDLVEPNDPIYCQMLKEQQERESKHKAKRKNVSKKLIKKVKTTAPTTEEKATVPTLTPEQQQAQVQSSELMSRAKTVSDPRQRQQLEMLAAAILGSVGLSPEG